MGTILPLIFWFSFIAAFVVTGGCSSKHSKAQAHAEALDRGRALAKTGDYQHAVQQFKTAIRLAPREAEGHYELGRALLGAGESAEAEQAFYRAVQLDSTYADARVVLAEVMVRQPDDEKVLTASQFAEQELAHAATGPNAAVAQFVLGVSLWRRGQLAEAASHLRSASTLRPDFLEAAASLAVLALTQNRTADAEKALLAVSPTPGRAEALGELYRVTGQLEKAESQFRIAAATESGPAARLNLAETLFTENRTHDAVLVLQEAVTRSAAPPFLFPAALLAAGMQAESIAELTRAAVESGDTAEARSRLIAALLLTGKQDQAILKIEQWLKKDANDITGLIARSEYFARSNQYRKAEQDVRKALLVRTSPEAHYALARVSYEQNEPAVARYELAEALRKENFIAARVQYSRMLLATGDSFGALSIIDETPLAQRWLPSVIAQRNWALLATGAVGEVRKTLDALHSTAGEFGTQRALLNHEEAEVSSSQAKFTEATGKAASDLATRAIAAAPKPFAAATSRADLLEYPRGPIFVKLDFTQFAYGKGSDSSVWPFFTQ